MAEISKSTTQTVDAIYAGKVAKRRSGDNATIGFGEAGGECSRALWYGFRWASEHEDLTGTKLRIFESGHLEEDRLIRELQEIGCELHSINPETGKQYKFYLVNGHVSGKPDGVARGILEAPKAWHIVECKSSNQKGYTPTVKKGVKDAKWLHWVSTQLYMVGAGIERAIYLMVNKNTDEIYSERVKLDGEFVQRLLNQLRAIVFSSEPLPKLHDDPEAKAAWQCKFCRHADVCHFDKWARVNCRTCLHSTPMQDGGWRCELHDRLLSYDDQQMGCTRHLYLPAIVPGEQSDADEDACTVTYTMYDGTEWIDSGFDKVRGQ